MGFYGNITNLRDTHFVFDKIFPNRTAMEREAILGADNIFTGRFVLVKYDVGSEFFIGDMLLGFYNTEDKCMYVDRNFTLPYVYTTFTHVEEPVSTNWNSYFLFNGTYYFHLPSEEYFVEGNNNYYTADVEDNNRIVGLNQIIRLRDQTTGEPTGDFYICTGENSGEPAIWNDAILHVDGNDYLANFNIDKETYKDSFDVRGYDATVWEKVYSEGYGRFVMIARLSGGVMPALELYPDAPSLAPNAPYIDALSTDAMYRIHVPSMFGFQIKTVDKEEDPNALSDQQILVTQMVYNDELDNYTPTLVEADAAIYFNKSGSDKAYRKVDTSTVNEILIEPTGESGKIYYDGEGNEVTTDLLELTVHVPAIGNMIADGYDLIYGYNEILDQEQIYATRPTDIDWIDGASSETLKLYGNTLLGGKSHNLNTLAGTLNTLHDRLGQIIVHTTVLPAAEQMSQQLIYEYNGRYYRRGIGNDPIPVPDSSYEYVYVPGITASNFEFNKYYKYTSDTIPENVVPDVATAYDSSQPYYFIKKITGARYHEIELEEYIPSTYYRKLGEDYLRDNADPYPTDANEPYYNITSTTEYTFDAEYSNTGRFFILDSETGIFTPFIDNIPIRNVTYYLLKNENGTYVANDIQTNKRWYQKGVYYYKVADASTGEEYFEPDNNDYATFMRSYYILQFSNQAQYGRVGNEVVEYYPMIGSTLIGYLEDPPLEDMSVYYFDNAQGQLIPYTYLSQMDDIDGKSPYTVLRTYYKINTSENYTNDLYLPNTYYTLEEDGSYLKSGEWGGRTKKYYTLDNIISLENPFYLPDKYYYEVTPNEFSIDRSSTKIRDAYYTKTSVYVDVDTLQQCPHGYEWNDNSPYIPPSITLYYKTELPSVVEIKGVSNGDNSINGAILNLHKEYDFGNLETRNEATFRGCLNKLNDMMYRIKELKPNEILTVNDFGQIISMPLTDLKAKLNALP